MTEPTTHQRKRERSPNFPGIALDKAIERAREIFEREGRGAVPPEAILDAWGYNPGSGLGMVQLAALTQFGLLNDQGRGAERRLRLSQLALTILLDDQAHSPDRDKALRSSAMAPSIHRELWEYCEGELPPSNTGIRMWLIRDRKFTANGADQFIKQVRATFDFAGVGRDDSLEPEPEDEEDATDEGSASRAPTDPPEERPTKSPSTERPLARERRPGVVTYSVPLKPGSDIVVEFPFPPTDDDWDYFVGMLGAVRSRLVVKPDRVDDPVVPAEEEEG